MDDVFDLLILIQLSVCLDISWVSKLVVKVVVQVVVVVIYGCTDDDFA